MVFVARGVIDKAVGVVHPSATRGEVILRAIDLAIEHRLAWKGVGLIDTPEGLVATVKREDDGLTLQVADVLEHPVIRLALRQADDGAAVGHVGFPALHTQAERPTFRLVRHREVQVAARDFHLNFGVVGADRKYCQKGHEQEGVTDNLFHRDGIRFRATKIEGFCERNKQEADFCAETLAHFIVNVEICNRLF